MHCPRNLEAIPVSFSITQRACIFNCFYYEFFMTTKTFVTAFSRYLSPFLLLQKGDQVQSIVRKLK